MNKKRWLVVTGSAVALILLGMALFIIMLPGNLVVGSLGEREIWGRTANRSGSCRFWAEGDTATVQLGRQSARVTADAVELGGGRVVSIPVNCRKIELFETRDGLRIFFDGNQPQ